MAKKNGPKYFATWLTVYLITLGSIYYSVSNNALNADQYGIDTEAAIEGAYNWMDQNLFLPYTHEVVAYLRDNPGAAKFITSYLLADLFPTSFVALGLYAAINKASSNGDDEASSDERGVGEYSSKEEKEMAFNAELQAMLVEARANNAAKGMDLASPEATTKALEELSKLKAEAGDLVDALIDDEDVNSETETRGQGEDSSSSWKSSSGGSGSSSSSSSGKSKGFGR